MKPKRDPTAIVAILVVYARYNENFVLVVTSGCCIRWDSTGYQGLSPWLVSADRRLEELRSVFRASRPSGLFLADINYLLITCCFPPDRSVTSP